jgi:hypothetical protein
MAKLAAAAAAVLSPALVPPLTLRCCQGQAGRRCCRRCCRRRHAAVAKLPLPRCRRRAARLCHAAVTKLPPLPLPLRRCPATAAPTGCRRAAAATDAALPLPPPPRSHWRLQPVSVRRLGVPPMANSAGVRKIILCTSPVLFGGISHTVPIFDGPSATRRECHILLKRVSDRASVHRTQ